MNSRTRSRPDSAAAHRGTWSGSGVPDLRKLFVAAQLAARDRGHDFLVCHGEAHVAAETRSLKRNRLSPITSSGRIPATLRLIQGGERKLLRAHCVHFLAHDV